MSKNTLRNLGKNLCRQQVWNINLLLLHYITVWEYIIKICYNIAIYCFVVILHQKFISSLSISSSNIKKNILFAVFIPCYWLTKLHLYSRECDSPEGGRGGAHRLGGTIVSENWATMVQGVIVGVSIVRRHYVTATILSNWLKSGPRISVSSWFCFIGRGRLCKYTKPPIRKSERTQSHKMIF